MSWSDLRKGRYSQQCGEYFIAFTSLNRVDYFNDPAVANEFCRHIQLNERVHSCKWQTWVLMPDHFHGLLQLQQNNLSEAVQHLKGITAHKINRLINKQGGVWQRAYYDRALRFEDDRKNIARYIVMNPVRAGLVNNIRKYPYWNSIYLE